jgi:hypothetical protein
VIILLLGFFSATSDISTQSETLEEHDLYFPLVEHLPIHMNAVITFNGHFFGLPSNSILNGYVMSQDPDPVYSVILEVEGTHYPFCEYPEPCDPYPVKIPLEPALTATLPGQVNPFKIWSLCYKDCTVYHSVRVLSASRDEPDGGGYFPLTVVRWEYADGTLSGTIRNDNRRTLHNMRLVAAELKLAGCGWKEAEIEDSTLEPGRRSTFQLQFSESCLGDNLVIVGQGAGWP